MANDTQITVLGNLTADPEVRFISSGAAVANFTVASTPRQFDKNTNEWKDGETLFMRCSVWRDQAENVAESLTKGMAVIVQGTLKSRSYEKDGQKRTVTELDVIEVGPSLRNASAKVTKGGTKGGGQQQPQQANAGAWGQQSQQAPSQWGNQPQQAAWGNPQAAQGAPAPF